jgi:DNA-binding transcriptional LysR family regulator
MIEPMNEIDHLSLDGHLLHLLVAVVEAGSVTAAGQRLGVTQSAVSHGLDKLRRITGDPLFVKSGRGIVATACAEGLAERARELLFQLQGFAHAGGFDPAQWRTTFTVAANDFQRDALLPPLAHRLRTLAPGVLLRVVPSGVPSLDMLRHGHCQLVISPRPPDGGDIVQKRLFTDTYRVFFDGSQRSAPTTRAEYEAAEHITVVYEADRPLAVDRELAAQGVARRFVVTVPGFAGLPAFLRGTPLLATAPGRLGQSILQGFDSAPVPLPCPELPMYLVWHARHQHDPAHTWLRGQVDAVVAALG